MDMKRWYVIRHASITDNTKYPCKDAIYSETFRSNKLRVRSWIIEIDDILDFVKKIGCKVIVSQESGYYDEEGNEYPEIMIYDDMIE